MPPSPDPLDIERLFVAKCGQRTQVRSPVALEEEDPVVAIVSHVGSTGAFPPGLPSARSAGRGQPSAAARRLRAAMVVVAVAAVGTLLGAGSLAGAEQATEPGSPRLVAQGVDAPSHVVQPGETLWSLARRLQPEGDVRPLVARLRAAAGGGPLVPGQRIRLAV